MHRLFGGFGWRWTEDFNEITWRELSAAVAKKPEKEVYVGNAQEVAQLYKEAGELRKKVVEAGRSVVEGKTKVHDVDVDYLRLKLFALSQMVFIIEDYSWWIQGKSVQWDSGDIQGWRKLIKTVGQLVPTGLSE